jgi:hypothetical protein
MPEPTDPTPATSNPATPTSETSNPAVAGPTDAAPGTTPVSEHRSRSTITRLPVVGAIAVLLTVGLVVGHGGSPHAPVPVAFSADGPRAAPGAALSSTWLCAGATGTRDGVAPGRLVVTNAGAHAVTATVTILGTNNAVRHVTTQVGPYSRQFVAETVPGQAAWTGAIVDLDGGDVTVEQILSGALGTTASPCATAGSTNWYFSSGATLVNATSTITLLNPYPSAAIVDLGFTTDQGQEAPQQFSGIVVPAGHLVSVDLGSHLRRRSAIATSVTATYGRIVAWKTDIVTPPRHGSPIVGTRAARRPDADPASPVVGVTALLGAPTAQTTWRWPEGTTADGTGEQYVVYNPGTRTADVALAVKLDESTASAEPFDLTLGPQETTTIATGQEARIPSGSGYSVTLTSTDGVPVVAERVVSQTAPAVYRGIGEMLGSAQTATRWLVGAGSVSRHLDEVIAVSNPGRTAVTVRLRSLDNGHLSAPAGVPSSQRIPAGGRVSVDLGLPTGSLRTAVLVQAGGPVVVERDLYGRRGTPGVSISLAVPLAP